MQVLIGPRFHLPLRPIGSHQRHAIGNILLEAQVAKLKPGPQREALLEKIRQLETASHMSEWLSSPGLRSPT
jgi:hypothetical protein